MSNLFQSPPPCKSKPRGYQDIVALIKHINKGPMSLKQASPMVSGNLFVKECCREVHESQDKQESSCSEFTLPEADVNQSPESSHNDNENSSSTEFEVSDFTSVIDGQTAAATECADFEDASHFEASQPIRLPKIGAEAIAVKMHLQTPRAPAVTPFSPRVTGLEQQHIGKCTPTRKNMHASQRDLLSDAPMSTTEAETSLPQEP